MQNPRCSPMKPLGSRRREFFSGVHCRPEVHRPHENSEQIVDGLRKVIGQLYNPNRKNNLRSSPEFFQEILSMVNSMDYEFKKLDELFSSFKMKGMKENCPQRSTFSTDDMVYITMAAKSLLKLVSSLKYDLRTKENTARGVHCETMCYTNQLIHSLEIKLCGLLTKLEQFKMQVTTSFPCLGGCGFGECLTSRRNRMSQSLQHNRSREFQKPFHQISSKYSCRNCNYTHRKDGFGINSRNNYNGTMDSTIKNNFNEQLKRGCCSSSEMYANNCVTPKVLNPTKNKNKKELKLSHPEASHNIRNEDLNSKFHKCVSDVNYHTLNKSTANQLIQAHVSDQFLKYSELLPSSNHKQSKQDKNIQHVNVPEECTGQKINVRRYRAGRDRTYRRERSQTASIKKINNLKKHNVRNVSKRKQNVKEEIKTSNKTLDTKTEFSNEEGIHGKKGFSQNYNKKRGNKNAVSNSRSRSKIKPSWEGNLPRRHKTKSRKFGVYSSKSHGGRSRSGRRDGSRVNRREGNRPRRHKTKSRKFSVYSSKSQGRRSRSGRRDGSRVTQKDQSATRKNIYRNKAKQKSRLRSVRRNPSGFRGYLGKSNRGNSRKKLSHNKHIKRRVGFHKSDTESTHSIIHRGRAQHLRNNRCDFKFSSSKGYTSIKRSSNNLDEVIYIEPGTNIYNSCEYEKMNQLNSNISQLNVAKHYEVINNDNKVYDYCHQLQLQDNSSFLCGTDVSNNYTKYFQPIPFYEVVYPEISPQTTPSNNPMYHYPVKMKCKTICFPESVSQMSSLEEFVSRKFKTQNRSETCFEESIAQVQERKPINKICQPCRKNPSKKNMLRKKHRKGKEHNTHEIRQEKSYNSINLCSYSSEEKIYLVSKASNETSLTSRGSVQTYTSDFKNISVSSLLKSTYEETSEENSQKSEFKSTLSITSKETSEEESKSESTRSYKQHSARSMISESNISFKNTRSKKKTVSDYSTENQSNSVHETNKTRRKRSRYKYVYYKQTPPQRGHGRYRRLGKFRKESSERVIEYVYPESEPPPPSPPPPSIPVPPHIHVIKETYSRGTSTEATPSFAKRTSTTELIKVLKTIGTNTQQLKERPKEIFVKSTSTEIIPLFPKITSTTDLIRPIVTIGTNTQLIDIMERGIDPMPEREKTPPPVVEMKTIFTNTDKINTHTTGTDSISEKPKPKTKDTAVDPLYYLGQKNIETNTIAERKKDLRETGTDPRPSVKVPTTSVATDPLYYLGQRMKNTNTMAIVTTNAATETLTKVVTVSRGTNPDQIATKDQKTSYDKIKTSDKGNNPITTKMEDKCEQFDTEVKKPSVKSVFTITDVRHMAGKMTQTSFVEQREERPSIHEVETQTIKRPRPKRSVVPLILQPPPPIPAKEESIQSPDISSIEFIEEPQEKEQSPSELSVHLVFQKCHEEIYRRRSDLCKPICLNDHKKQKFLICEKKRSNIIRITNRSDSEKTKTLKGGKSTPNIDLDLLFKTQNNKYSKTKTERKKSSNGQRTASYFRRPRKPKLSECCGMSSAALSTTDGNNCLEYDWKDIANKMKNEDFNV